PTLQSLAASSFSFSDTGPLFSIACSLFLQSTRWGTPTLPRRPSLPPSYAPRGASIPCTLIRLRILPVHHGCTPLPPSQVATGCSNCSQGRSSPLSRCAPYL